MAVVAGDRRRPGRRSRPSAHAPTTGRAATSLSIRTVHAAVRPGASDTVTGTLGVAGPLTAAGRTVTLEARPLGTDGFTPGRRRGRRRPRRAARGRHARRDHPLPLALRRRHRRPAELQRRRHRPRPYAAAPGPADRHLALDPRRPPPGRASTAPTSSAVACGPVASRCAHRLVILVSRTADATGWTFEGAHRTRRLGAVAFRVKPDEDTAYRLVFLGYAAPAARAQRRRPGRHPPRPSPSPPTRPGSTSGGTTTVSGVASDDGTPIAGATVKLLAAQGRHSPRSTRSPPARPPATARSAFTDTPTRDDGLPAPAGRRRPACPAALSDAARVAVRIPTSLSIRGRATAHRLRGQRHAARWRSPAAPVAPSPC